MNAIERSLRETRTKKFGSNRWGERHVTAWRRPSGDVELAVRDQIDGWSRYAENYKTRFSSPITSCGVLGPVWIEQGRLLLDLLNGELGRLDAGTLDGLIRRVVLEHGGDLDAR